MEKLFANDIYIEDTVFAINDSKSKQIGTGFIINIDDRKYLVTAEHVLNACCTTINEMSQDPSVPISALNIPILSAIRSHNRDNKQFIIGIMKNTKIIVDKDTDICVINIDDTCNFNNHNINDVKNIINITRDHMLTAYNYDKIKMYSYVNEYLVQTNGTILKAKDNISHINCSEGYSGSPIFSYEEHDIQYNTSIKPFHQIINMVKNPSFMYLIGMHKEGINNDTFGKYVDIDKIVNLIETEEMTSVSSYIEELNNYE
jgi:hypothetical protein